MSTSKHIDRICIAVIVVALIGTVLFMFGKNLGLQASTKKMAYEETLFDTSKVHEIDIVMDDWDAFLETCENEEYELCTVVIDGEKQGNVAIRAKGNTSLSTVETLGSQRYSFKLEFDHYQEGKTYKGLDKLCLNNLIQDNTMMKDYLVYQMMYDMGVDAPLCSYAYITVNGEDWGLYLCVEGVEDSFLTRNYGSESGELYKPDSTSFGAGRGNGKEFNMDDFDLDNIDLGDIDIEQIIESGEFPEMPEGFSMPEGSEIPSDINISVSGKMPEMGENFDMSQGEMPSQQNNQFGGGMSGMGSDDVKLKYIDDDPDSYSNIFDNAKTDIDDSDKTRLISSLKSLSAYENLEDVVDIEEVIRYFVVHNFVRNGDSYTGTMIHNYYLYENDGQMSMIPWDYNLAFGTFQGNDASGEINADIDSPVDNGNVDDRPMVGWIFSNDEYTDEYHELFAEFISRWFTNDELVNMIEETKELISPYVEKDPTKFATVEEFEAGVDAIKNFVSLRAEAVARQLSGDNTLVEIGSLNLSDMGTMSAGGQQGGMQGGKQGEQQGEMPGGRQGGPQGGQQGGMTGNVPSGQSPGQAPSTTQ